MRWIQKSIFLRLLFSYVITVLLGLSLVGVALSFLVSEHINHTKQEELLRKAKKVNMALQNLSITDPAAEQVLHFFDEAFDTRIWIFDPYGKVIATSSKDEVSIGKSVSPTVVEKVLRGEVAMNELQFEGLTKPYTSVAISWGQESVVYGGIVLHAPENEMMQTIGQIREMLVWASLFGILFSLGMGSYLSWSISRPLRQIDRVVNQIGHGDYSERIHIDYVDELGDLAITINKMADKLQTIDQERKKIDQLQSDFLANVSHELRTPLTAMQGFLEALQDGLISSEASHKYYEVMYKETIHMNRLVDDILDLIRLENNEINLSKQWLDLSSLLGSVAFTFQQEAKNKQNEISVQVDEGLKLYADLDRMEQIIVNLVKNAMKFTDHGRIELIGQQTNEWIVLKIADTGIGISEHDQALIWGRFFKVDRGRSRKNKGTGLGLAIVKELVELHHGTIEVESRLGEGTTFMIKLPVK